MSVERQNAVINNEIILRSKFQYAQTLDYFDPYAISKVEILDSNQTTVIETIVSPNIIRDSLGQYHVVAAAIATAKTIYDKWYFTPSAGADEIANTNSCVVWNVLGQSDEDLTTATNFKVNFDIKAAFTDHDTIIANLVTQMSKRCAEYCDRHFLADNYTEYYDGGGGNKLLLNQYPVNSITTIHDDTDRVYGSDTLISSDDYVLSNAGKDGIVKFDGVILSDGINNIKVVYNAGYLTIPQDLVNACEKLVMAEYVEHLASVNVATSDEVIYKPDKLRKEAYAILDRYKNYVQH